MSQNEQADSGTQPNKTKSSRPNQETRFNQRHDQASPSLTPQSRIRPQQVTTFAAPAAPESANPNQTQMTRPSRQVGSGGLQMPARSNINNQNSQIHGRKVDSPKIYFKDDVSEGRTKTSAKGSRETASQQLASKQKSLNSKRQGFKPQGGSAQLFTQPTSQCHNSLQSTEGRRFDFTFATEHANPQRKLVNQLPSSATAKQTTHASSHTIQFEGQIGNPPKTTSNAALSSNPMGYGSLSKYQQSRQLASNNFSNNNGKLHSVKESKSASNQTTRKRIQSQGLVSKQISGLGINKQSVQTSNAGPSSKQQPPVNLQLTVNSPLCGGKSVRVNNRLPPRHSKLQKQKEALPSKRSKRTRSTDQTSKPTLAAAQRSKGGRKPRLNQTLISNINGGHLAGAVQTTRAGTGSNHYRSNISNSVGQSLNKTTMAGGGKNLNHFSFELDNKENLVSTSSQQNFGPISDKGAAPKSGSASRSRGRSHHARKVASADHNDISLSSLSGQSKEMRGDASLSGNMSKMFNKNYFVDGEQILRLHSPGTPNRSDDQMKSLMSGGANNNTSGICYTDKTKPEPKSTKNKNATKQKLRNSISGHKGSADNVVGLNNKSSKGETSKRSQNNAHALLRKFIEETQRKTERDRHEKSEERRRLQDMVRNKYKKTRSKSCISKVDPHAAVFSVRKDKEREKSNEVQKNNGGLLSETVKDRENCRRNGQRERSCVLELKQLKREVNEEIRRERKEGLSDVLSGGNLSVTNQKSRPISTRVKGEITRQSINLANQTTPVYTSLRRAEAGVLMDRVNKDEIQKSKKDKSGDLNNNKIRKFIEKQKKRMKAKKSMEQTIEHEKNLRIKQTLIDLQNFSRTGKSKERTTQLRSSYTTNQKKIYREPGKNSTKQLQMVDRIPKHFPIQEILQAQQQALPRHSIHTDRQEASPDLSNSLPEGERQFALKSEFNQRTLQGSITDQTGAISMFKQEFRDSNSASRRQSSSKHRPRRDQEDNQGYPLRQLGNKKQKSQVRDLSQSSGGYSNSAKANRNMAPKNIQLQSHTVHDLDSSGERRNEREEEAFDSINRSRGYPSKTQNISGLGGSDFESLEPSRPAADNRGQKNFTSQPVNNSTVSDLYDQSGLPANRRYHEEEIDQFEQQEYAAILIQRFVKDYFMRKSEIQNQRDREPDIEIDSSTEDIIQNSKQDPNTTAQSVRKSINIPNLDLKKINSSESHPNQQLQVDTNQNQGAISSARSASIFDRDSFQQFKMTSLKPKDDGSLPELIKVREEAIQYRQIQEQNFLAQEFSQNKFSPRTYKIKQRELETWVTKEREEVKKTKKVFEQEWEKTAKIINSTSKDTQQVKQILSSARSSNKLRLDDSSHPMVSSARTGLNSIRIDSQRKSQRVEESKLIDMIYDRKGGERLANENSSQSNNDHMSNPSNSHQQSHSSYHEELEQEHYGDERTDRSEKVPNFDQVVVLNTTGSKDQKLQRNTSIEVDDFFNNKGPQIKSFDDAKVDEISAEKSLQRVTSYKTLDQKETSEDERDQQVLPASGSPRPLHKSDATQKLPDLIDEDEADLARQVMAVENAFSNSSQSPIKDELKESLRSQNFFISKMDGQQQSPKQGNNSRVDSSNIRIEISGEMQNKQSNQDPNSMGMNNAIGAVSPLSGASSNLGIQGGSVSLESSTSGEQRQQLQQVIEEVKQKGEDEQIAARTEELTDEIMQLLEAELRLDFDFLVSRRDPRQQEEEEQHQQIQGIKTDLFAIERYVDEVVEEIKANQNEFMNLLNEPLERDILTVLNKMQNSEIGSCEHFDEKFPQVLPLELYLCLEKRRKEARERQLEEQGIARGATEARPNSQTELLKNLLAECEHIHNKVLFDCINDSLLQFKPYGKEGEPLPWGRKNRRLKPTDDFTLSEVFEIVKHDLFRWAITNAGTLPRRDYVYRGVFDEDLWQDVREKKLVGLLAREMIESEPKWLNYEFEQAQVKIDTGDMILEALMGEAIQIMNEGAARDFSGHPLLAPDSEEEAEEQDALEQPESRRVSGSSRLSRHRSRDQDEYSRDSDFSNNNMSDDD